MHSSCGLSSAPSESPAYRRTSEKYVIRWLCVRLQYPHCVRNADTAILHQTVGIFFAQKYAVHTLQREICERKTDHILMFRVKYSFISCLHTPSKHQSRNVKIEDISDMARKFPFVVFIGCEYCAVWLKKIMSMSRVSCFHQH